MNILILNWRDIGSPHSGGAEILTHEMAKRWIKKAHTVTQFSARFSGARKNDSIDGVRIIREGSAEVRSLSVPVFVAAYFWYRHEEERKYDVVIDEIHGIPFFTPWYVRRPTVALICEVA